MSKPTKWRLHWKVDLPSGGTLTVDFSSEDAEPDIDLAVKSISIMLDTMKLCAATSQSPDEEPKATPSAQQVDQPA